MGPVGRRFEHRLGSRGGRPGMSSVLAELPLGEPRTSRTPRLPAGAWLYFGAVVVATLGAAVPLVPRIHVDGSAWTKFFALSACAAIAQLFVVRTIRDQSYHTSTAFLIAGALL